MSQFTEPRERRNPDRAKSREVNYTFPMHSPLNPELVVFLGNPGKQYSQTRHNTGRMLLSFLPDTDSLIWREKFNGRIADYSTTISRCRFLLPETFMNRSGLSVSAAVNFYKINLNNLLVVHDDLELPFGAYSWREGGGLAGHNGLKSLKDSLGGTGFLRLRLGIGRPVRGTVQSWVLGRFTPEEEGILPLVLSHAAESFTGIISGRESFQKYAEPVMVYSP